jgi:hypothetical protein
LRTARPPRDSWLGAAGRVVGPYESGLVGDNDGLDPVAERELHQDPADMSLDGALLDHQLGGYLSVGQPARDEPQHIKLPLREVLQLRWPKRGGRTA